MAQAQSILFSIPSEIRLQIYQHVAPPLLLEAPLPDYFGLLYSCKRIFHELESEAVKAMDLHLQILCKHWNLERCSDGKRTLRSIKNLVFIVPNPRGKDSLLVLGSLELESLSIIDHIGDGRGNLRLQPLLWAQSIYLRDGVSKNAGPRKIWFTTNMVAYRYDRDADDYNEDLDDDDDSNDLDDDDEDDHDGNWKYFKRMRFLGVVWKVRRVLDLRRIFQAYIYEHSLKYKDFRVVLSSG